MLRNMRSKLIGSHYFDLTAYSQNVKLFVLFSVGKQTLEVRQLFYLQNNANMKSFRWYTPKIK